MFFSCLLWQVFTRVAFCELQDNSLHIWIGFWHFFTTVYHCSIQLSSLKLWRRGSALCSFPSCAPQIHFATPVLAFSSHSVVHATLPPQLYIDVPSLARAYYTCILKLIGTFYLSKDIVTTKLIIIKFIIWTIKVLVHVRLSKFQQYIYI